MNATEMNVKRNLSVLRTHGVPAAGAQVTRSPPRGGYQRRRSPSQSFRSKLAARTSMISVCACFVQKAWGGVVALTATKLFGFRSSDGVCNSLQAMEPRQERNESLKIRLPLILSSKHAQRKQRKSVTLKGWDDSTVSCHMEVIFYTGNKLFSCSPPPSPTLRTARP